MLNLTAERVEREEVAGGGDLRDSNPHHEESDFNEEDGAEEIKVSQTPPRRSG